MDVDAMVHACMADSIGASRMHMGLSIDANAATYSYSPTVRGSQGGFCDRSSQQDAKALAYTYVLLGFDLPPLGSTAF
jgi:hypothetical protein